MKHCCFAGCDLCPTCGECRRTFGCRCGSGGCTTNTASWPQPERLKNWTCTECGADVPSDMLAPQSSAKAPHGPRCKDCAEVVPFQP